MSLKLPQPAPPEPNGAILGLLGIVYAGSLRLHFPVPSNINAATHPMVAPEHGDRHSTRPQ
eukprot:5713125-Heterocapsa_arctica.AAC.1